jgi:hypothetical protein
VPTFQGVVAGWAVIEEYKWYGMFSEEGSHLFQALLQVVIVAQKNVKNIFDGRGCVPFSRIVAEG